MMTDDQKDQVENLVSEEELKDGIDVPDSKTFSPKNEIQTTQLNIELGNNDIPDSKGIFPNGNQTIPSDTKLENNEKGTQILTAGNVLPVYNMNYSRVGKCIIFNQEDFSSHTNYKNRIGTNVDCQSLENTFSKLGFDVEIHKDLKVGEIRSVLQKASEEDHSDAACFACCLLTHGIEGKFLARDKEFNTEELWEKFVGKRCKTLIGKPKLFFIQACQGEKKDKGVDVPDGRAVEPTARIPNQADFLIAQASIYGYTSWRNPEKGSVYIQTLCEFLTKLVFEDIQTILTAVAYKVSHEYESSEKYKQMPSFLSMLTKKLYLGGKLK